MSFPIEPIQIVSIELTRALVAAGFGLGYDTDAAQLAADGVGRFTATLAPASSATATPGAPYPPLAIVGCTGSGVFPIVITTAHPHGVSNRPAACGGMSGVIQGVTGNTAANHLDADPTSRTHGLPAGVLAVPLTATTLALYGQDPVEGNLIPLVGNGAYAGGGTIVPAFGDGSILIGLDCVREHSAPPRLVLVPSGITSLPRVSSSPNPGRRNAERRALIQQRSIGTDVIAFDAHAWGASNPPDSALDFSLTYNLRSYMRAALHDLACGTSEEGAGKWDDQAARATQYVKAGHLLTFAVSIRVPVTDNPLPGGLPFVNDGTVIGVTVQTNTPEIAATFNAVTINPE